MPGSPPIRTSVPGTIPPPSTRSNSVTPEEILTSSCDSISEYAIAVTSRSFKELRAAPLVLRERSSTSEFHSPHSGHLPSHLPDLCPQFWHTKIVSEFFFNAVIATLSGFRRDVQAPRAFHAQRWDAELDRDA